MLQSSLFTRTRKQPPKDEVSLNAKFLIRAGFVDKLHAGIYTFLPLGLRVLNRITAIVRREMEALGGQEILMPSLHPKENWETTGRWKTMDDLYKTTDAAGREFALGPTHEEVVVPLMKQFVSSYRDLPLFVYQFQTKFRMELRAKSGLLRGREFLMKDMYSFHADEADLDAYYARVKDAYARIFNEVGIGKQTYPTLAAGGTFSAFSHEFQTVTPAGEDTIYVCRSCGTAVNKEIVGTKPTCGTCGATDMAAETAIEVGNIFPLKTKFSDAFDLRYTDPDGNREPVCMGCYGIGIGRLMGAVAEVFADENGLVWPESVSPFSAHLLSLDTPKEARTAYEALTAKGISVLYDNRDCAAGEKLADADLIGIPYRLIVSKKTGAKIEMKKRTADETNLVSVAECVKIIQKS